MREDSFRDDATGETTFRVDLDWVEHMAAENCYAVAERCLDDALRHAREREHHSLRCLIKMALENVRNIGRIYDINGQKRLDF